MESKKQKADRLLQAEWINRHEEELEERLYADIRQSEAETEEYINKRRMLG